MKCDKCGSENVVIQMKGSENDGVRCLDCGYDTAGKWDE